MYELRVKQAFDAAHYIKDYQGKCSREHGHRWTVQVCLQGQKLDKRNILVDFKQVKDAMNRVIDQYLDHYQLNETLGQDNLTAEYLAEWFCRQMQVGNSKDVQVVSVEIWESPECSVKYCATS